MRIIIFSLFLFCLKFSFAQESNVSAGGNFFGINGSVSFSLGQLNYDYIEGSNGKINVGVQQNYSIIELPDGVFTNKNFELKVYPNPTSDILEIKSCNENIEIEYQIINSEGKLLVHKKINSENEKISLKENPNGVYFLNVYNDEKIIKSFKIIKNKF